MELVHKLTDGYIYTFRATPLSIMPETFHVIPSSSHSGCKRERDFQ